RRRAGALRAGRARTEQRRAGRRRRAAHRHLRRGDRSSLHRRRKGAAGGCASQRGATTPHRTGGAHMSRPKWWRIALALLAVTAIAGACGGDDDASDGAGTDGGGESAGPTIRIRGQEFSENMTLAEVYGQYLAARGFDVEILTPAGFRTEALDALENGQVDLVIDYIGGQQTALDPDSETSSDPDEVVSVIEPLLEEKGL